MSTPTQEEIDKLTNKINSMEKTIARATSQGSEANKSILICTRENRSILDAQKKMEAKNEAINQKTNEIIATFEKFQNASHEDGSASSQGGINKEQFLSMLQNYLQNGLLETQIKNYIENNDLSPKTSIEKKDKKKSKSNLKRKFLIGFLTISFLGAFSIFGSRILNDNSEQIILIKPQTPLIRLSDSKTVSLKKIMKTKAEKVIFNKKYYFDFKIGKVTLRVPANKVKVLK